MKKTKKIIAAVIILAASLSLFAACTTSFTDAEKFAARANITLSQGISDYPDVSQGDTYVFTSIEYFTSGPSRIIRADCVINKADGTFVRYVFLISDREDYLNDAISSVEGLWEFPGFIEETGLFFANLFDYDFTPDENNSVSILNVMDLTTLYHKNGDKALLGMN
jgi:hypothetical protein